MNNRWVENLKELLGDERETYRSVYRGTPLDARISDTQVENRMEGHACWDRGGRPKGWTKRTLLIWSRGYLCRERSLCGNFQGILRVALHLLSRLLARYEAQVRNRDATIRRLLEEGCPSAERRRFDALVEKHDIADTAGGDEQFGLVTGKFDVCADYEPGPPPTVKSMVAEALKARGYDGLSNDAGGCGCLLDDLMPCGGTVAWDCQAGYRHPCDSECECGDDCGWHIGSEKPTAGDAENAEEEK